MLGDTPYTAAEVPRLDALIDEMNAERLAFVVHVGDIGGGNACNDGWLEARRQQFARIRAPFVLVPGDNEWKDCRDQTGRLAAWRRFFCGVRLAVERQAGEYCEHMRWQAAGWVFATLNVPGHDNNLRNVAEHARRMAAVLAWLDDSASLAREKRSGLVLLMQANPFLTVPRDGFVELRERLSALASGLPDRLVLVHGDTHTYHDDEPLPGLHRVEVWGSPIVSWIRGALDEGELRFSAPRYR